MKKILLSSLVFVFVFSITFSVIAEENTPLSNIANNPVVDSEPQTVSPKPVVSTDKANFKSIKKLSDVKVKQLSDVKVKQLSDVKVKQLSDVKVKKLSIKTLKCISTAVEKRETAILANIETYSTAIKKSFKTRKTDLLSAWNIVKTKKRNIAIKKAFAKNKKAKRDALKIYKKTRLATWQAFTKARIACKTPATGEDMSADMNFND